MARNGYRHRLVLYTFMLTRWGRLTLGIGIVVVILAAGLGGLPVLLPQYHFFWVSDALLWAVGLVGGLTLLASIALFGLRKSAYVQPFSDHILLVTPFLRMNISFRRIRKATSAEMERLFPLERYKGVNRSILRPFAKKTVIVLDMIGWPMPRGVLKLFLSPFFFPDKTSRLALLVQDWMAFSTDMESFRSVWQDSLRPASGSPQADLLRTLSKSNRK